MRPTVKEIILATAGHYNLTYERLMRQDQSHPVAHPRQLAMYLARKLCGRTYPDIGASMDRDHSTIMNGVRRVEARLDNPEIIAAILAISAEATRMVREREAAVRAQAAELHIAQAKTVPAQLPVTRLPRTPAAHVPQPARWTLSLYDRVA